MRVSVDKEADLLSIQLYEDRESEESEEIEPGVIVDFDAQGEIVGIDIMNLSTRVGAAPTLVAALREIASLATQDINTRHASELLRDVEQKARAALARATG